MRSSWAAGLVLLAACAGRPEITVGTLPSPLIGEEGALRATAARQLQGVADACHFELNYTVVDDHPAGAGANARWVGLRVVVSSPCLRFGVNGVEGEAAYTLDPWRADYRSALLSLAHELTTEVLAGAP